MREPDEVAATLPLKALGWGVRRIARELGCSHMTVRRYLSVGGWAGYRRPRRASALDGLEAWIAERFFQHRGNADVVRQELASELGVKVSLRTVERAVAPLRKSLADLALSDCCRCTAAEDVGGTSEGRSGCTPWSVLRRGRFSRPLRMHGQVRSAPIVLKKAALAGAPGR